MEKGKNRIKAENLKFFDWKNKKIFGIKIWRLLGYFIVYSVIGFFLETAFGVITKGVLESRKSFLYGPFCGIYGLGAIVMIIGLQPFKKNNNTLFWGGFLVGSIIEYVVSWIGEIVFDMIWWNYSNMPLNLNGRVCAFFSIFWGILGIYLITYVNPKIDKFIDWGKNKVSIKALKAIEVGFIIFLLFDCLITAYALKMFYIRMVAQNNINIGDVQKTKQQYDEIYSNEKLKDFIYKFFDDEKMIKTFPNLKMQDNEGNVIFFRDFAPEIKPYYRQITKSGIGDTIGIRIENDIENYKKEKENKNKVLENSLGEQLISNQN